MTGFQTLLDQERSRTIADLDGFNLDAARAAGVDDRVITDWKRIHHTYYGTTRSPKKQRTTRLRAEHIGTPLAVLAIIERYLAHITNDADKWRYRNQLLTFTGTCTALKRAAKNLIPAKETPPPKKGMRFTRPVAGVSTITITTTERFSADLEHQVSRNLDPGMPAAEQKLANFEHLLRSGGSLPHAQFRPIVVVGLDQHIRILTGDGDDVTLGLTDGTTITGADYLNHLLTTTGTADSTADNAAGSDHAAIHGDATTDGGTPAVALAGIREVGLFHPQHGPVNLYDRQRLANQKQRDLAKMTTPICPVPECRMPAELCEIHHIAAWRNGGHTNIDNLSPLCRYHNRVNDDDTQIHRRGRVENLAGRPTWVSPSGHPVANTAHPYGAMDVLYGPPPAPPNNHKHTHKHRSDPGHQPGHKHRSSHGHQPGNKHRSSHGHQPGNKHGSGGRHSNEASWVPFRLLNAQRLSV